MALTERTQSSGSLRSGARRASGASSRALLRAGLDVVPGGVALVAMRALLVLLASLPALLMLVGTIAAGSARQPFFTDEHGRLPLFHLARLAGELSGPVTGAIALTTILVLLGEQVLVAGGLEWLGAAGRDDEPQGGASAWRAVPRQGIGWLWTMLKVVVMAGIFAGLGLALVARLFDWLGRGGEVSGWSGHALWLVLPALHGLCSVVWLALVGAWAFWCRVLLVADGRRTVRSAWFLVLKVWRRHPLRGPLFYVLVTLASQAGGAVVLAIWRQRPPAAATGAAMWIGTWALTLVLQAYLWYWLLHAGRLLYALPDLEGIRQRPDGPIGIGRALRRMVGRLRPGT